METPEIATLSEYNSQCKKAIPGDSTALRLRRLRKRARDRRPCPRQPGILIPTRRSWAPQRYRPGRLPNGIECTGRKSVQAAPGSGETPAGEFRPRAGGPRNPTAYTELLIPPRHPVHAVPRLVAKAPNHVWSWDITKLLGPVKWTYFYLYVVLDIFSRYVVGWTLSRRESASLAEKLIATCAQRFGIVEGQLTVHADRGASMTSKPVALLLADLGVTKSHSRPRVSNDNPFSEAQFKTLKYRPGFPDRFGSLQDARAHCRDFFLWYNTVHHHSALGLLTPADVHFGRASAILAARTEVLRRAYEQHPERFPRGLPLPNQPPLEVWINRPSPNTVEASEPDASELIEAG